MRIFFMIAVICHLGHTNPVAPKSIATHLADFFLPTKNNRELLAKENGIVLTGDQIMDERDLQKAAHDREKAFSEKEKKAERVLTKKDVLKERQHILSIQGGARRAVSHSVLSYLLWEKWGAIAHVGEKDPHTQFNFDKKQFTFDTRCFFDIFLFSGFSWAYPIFPQIFAQSMEA